MTDELNWVSEVPKDELLALHYALCIALKVPYLDDAQTEKFRRLANICWNEHCARLTADVSDIFKRYGYDPDAPVSDRAVPERLLEDLA